MKNCSLWSVTSFSSQFISIIGLTHHSKTYTQSSEVGQFRIQLFYEWLLADAIQIVATCFICFVIALSIGITAWTRRFNNLKVTSLLLNKLKENGIGWASDDGRHTDSIFGTYFVIGTPFPFLWKYSHAKFTS